MKNISAYPCCSLTTQPQQYEVDLDDYGFDYASGWNASTEAFYENNISFGHTTYECCGHYINSIAGVDEPTDGSWYWAVYVWNHTTEDWEMSPVGVDGIVMDEVEHIAFAPSAYSTETIPSPEEHQDDHEGHDDDDDYVFYCSNDGEEYANSMGGILCPEDAGKCTHMP